MISLYLFISAYLALLFTHCLFIKMTEYHLMEIVALSFCRWIKGITVTITEFSIRIKALLIYSLPVMYEVMKHFMYDHIN